MVSPNRALIEEAPHTSILVGAGRSHPGDDTARERGGPGRLERGTLSGPKPAGNKHPTIAPAGGNDEVAAR